MTTPETTSTHGILGAPEARGFELTRHPPAADLADYIERHWVVRWSLPPGETFTQELLPHPCVNLVTESSGSAVHGMPLSRSQHRLEGRGMAIGTKFRPGGLAPFLQVPAKHLVDRSSALPSLFGEDGATLERRLAAAAQDPAEHIAAVEDFLRERVPAPDRRLELLRDVVADMLVADRSIGVAGFAQRHAMSGSTLQRLFRDYVGVTPKWVLKRYRVHEAAERIAAGESTDLARLAADLGYFDQPHFNGDFTEQVGVSPGNYLRACMAARGAGTSLATPSRQAA
jgi:AraC-like DNA-binding protein